MSKNYEIEGKLYRFNTKKFAELVNNKAKEQNCKNTWIFKEINRYLHPGIDNDGNKVYRWYKGINDPVDFTYVKDISNFFGVDHNQFLITAEKGEVKMNNENKVNDVISLKKYQQEELLKIKDAILDYMYSNYTSAFWDDYIGESFDGRSLVDRLIDKRKRFNVDEYFSNEELIEIDEERKIEDEALTKGYESNVPNVNLLDEYRCLKENALMYELLRRIERSLSVLPFEIVNEIKELFSIFTAEDQYFFEIGAAGRPLHYEYKSFKDTLEIDSASDIYPSYLMDGDIKIDNEELRRYSVYNTIMFIHKKLNELLYKYCN